MIDVKRNKTMEIDFDITKIRWQPMPNETTMFLNFFLEAKANACITQLVYYVLCTEEISVDYVKFEVANNGTNHKIFKQKTHTHKRRENETKTKKKLPLNLRN